MGKKLNDWLDEFVVNGADPNVVPEWPDNVSGGGVELVDTLPTTGNVNKLYKLPNGNIYSYYRNITIERVPVYKDMEVGGTYSLKPQIEFKHLSKICQPELGNHEVELHFVPEGQYGSCIELRYEAMEATLYRATFYPHIFNGVAEDDDPPYAKFSALGEEVSEDSIIQVYASDLQDAPSFTINEQFVSELENQGLNLSDFEAFFNLEIDHYEEVEHINEGWSNINQTDFVTMFLNILTDIQLEEFIDEIYFENFKSLEKTDLNYIVSEGTLYQEKQNTAPGEFPYNIKNFKKITIIVPSYLNGTGYIVIAPKENYGLYEVSIMGNISFRPYQNMYDQLDSAKYMLAPYEETFDSGIEIAYSGFDKVYIGLSKIICTFTDTGELINVPGKGDVQDVVTCDKTIEELYQIYQESTSAGFIIKSAHPDEWWQDIYGNITDLTREDNGQGGYLYSISFEPQGRFGGYGIDWDYDNQKFILWNGVM